MNHRNQSNSPRILMKALLLVCVVAFAGALAATPLLAQGTAAQNTPPPKTPEFSAPAILIEQMDPGDVPIPPDFRVAVYEYTIEQVQRTGVFKNVYRSGDKNAAGAAGLVTMKSVATAFTKGSEKQRDVTTFKGWSSIKLHVTITDASGKTLVEQDLEGRVRFTFLPTSGNSNLDATNDFAHKVAKLVKENFKPAT